jgi:hypothetical protein
MMQSTVFVRREPIIVSATERVIIPDDVIEYDTDLEDDEELIQSSWYHRALLGDEFGRVQYRFVDEYDYEDEDSNDDTDEEAEYEDDGTIVF